MAAGSRLTIRSRVARLFPPPDRNRLATLCAAALSAALIVVLGLAVGTRAAYGTLLLGLIGVVIVPGLTNVTIRLFSGVRVAFAALLVTGIALSVVNCAMTAGHAKWYLQLLTVGVGFELFLAMPLSFVPVLLSPGRLEKFRCPSCGATYVCPARERIRVRCRGCDGVVVLERAERGSR